MLKDTTDGQDSATTPTFRDAALVRQLAEGDEQAFAEVVTAYSPAMMRVASGFGFAASVAEEVVQEAWLALLSGLDKFQGRAALRTWACGITANLARRRAAKEARSVPWTDVFAGPFEDGNDAPTVEPCRFRSRGEPWAGGWTAEGAPTAWEPERGALDTEFRTVISQALGELPIRQRTVVALRDIHGFSAEEVCTSLGVTPSNQRVLLHRGRAQLRQRLEDYRKGGLT